MAKEALRLRASRLAAGYQVGRDAALALGIPFQTYRNAETGNITPGKALISAVISRLGVSESFLRSGRATTPIDELAVRIANVLEAAESDVQMIDPTEYAERLKTMRAEAGYKTPSAAAKAMGWAVQTYSAHEASQNPIPIERQVCYALAFRFRPEYAVLGELPKHSRKSGIEENWRDLRAEGAVVAAPSVAAWNWLRGSETSFAVITCTKRRIHVLDQRLSVPNTDLSDGLRRSGRASLYAFRPTDSSSIFYLVDPLATAGPMVMCQSDGQVSISSADVATTIVSDPVDDAPVRSSRSLGRLVAKVSVRVTFS